jgi:hypothetical protein
MEMSGVLETYSEYETEILSSNFRKFMAKHPSIKCTKVDYALSQYAFPHTFGRAF